MLWAPLLWVSGIQEPAVSSTDRAKPNPGGDFSLAELYVRALSAGLKTVWVSRLASTFWPSVHALQVPLEASFGQKERILPDCHMVSEARTLKNPSSPHVVPHEFLHST